MLFKIKKNVSLKKEIINIILDIILKIILQSKIIQRSIKCYLMAQKYSQKFY